MKDPEQIERRAKKELRTAGMYRAPVDVVRLAEHLGAEIRPEMAPDNVSGGLYRIDGAPVIGVNARHHPNRQRFTIAHEIGHLLLHDVSEFVDHAYSMDADSQAGSRFNRDEVSSAAMDPREIEANRFAASLLMPAEFVLKKMVGESVPVRSESVEDLARQFGVSAQAMGFRLQNLGITLDLV